MDINDPDMLNSILKNAQQLQEGLRSAYDKAQEKNKDILVSGKAGGDWVSAQVDLTLQVRELTLKPELFSEKPEVVSELIMAAINQALHVAQKSAKQDMSELTKQFANAKGMPFPFKGE